MLFKSIIAAYKVSSNKVTQSKQQGNLLRQQGNLTHTTTNLIKGILVIATLNTNDSRSTVSASSAYHYFTQTLESSMFRVSKCTG